jgi:hypothetical protein
MDMAMATVDGVGGPDGAAVAGGAIGTRTHADIEPSR